MFQCKYPAENINKDKEGHLFTLFCADDLAQFFKYNVLVKKS